ncbi:TolC family protein [Aeromonas veronii]|uniref:TolC family protein n=1 Tax=Aeromonas veronii TaxID=654 RepID=UPI0031FCE209
MIFRAYHFKAIKNIIICFFVLQIASVTLAQEIVDKEEGHSDENNQKKLSSLPEIQTQSEYNLTQYKFNDENSKLSLPSTQNKSSSFSSIEKHFERIGVSNEDKGELQLENKAEYPAGDYAKKTNRTSLYFLRDIVVQAFMYSPELKATSAEVNAAEYNIKQAEGLQWPQVKLGVRSPFSTFGGDDENINDGVNNTALSILVSTSLYDGGGISNQINSAEEKMKAVHYLDAYSRDELAYNALSELININRYSQSKHIAMVYVKRMQELVNMLSEITSSDPGRASELVQAQSRLIAAETSLNGIEHNLDTSYINLTKLLGKKIYVPDDLNWKVIFISADMALKNVNSNPMLLSLKSKIGVANYDAESIKSNALPKINFIVSNDTAFGDGNSDDSGVYTGLSVDWDVFSGGSQDAAQMSARAKAIVAKQEYASSYRDVEYQIKSQLQIRDASLQQSENYEALSAETDKVRRMFFGQWYHLGKRTLLDVLTAESEHYNNQISAVNNRYDSFAANNKVVFSSSLLLPMLGLSSKGKVEIR